ncbi:MAG: ATP-binding protein [Bacteroidetes bacterium]|nr:ATP-binding protein [Bacteroidota bacterium]MCY4234208.1 ATP-binding protein [Bacteroidota bacterium]
MARGDLIVKLVKAGAVGDQQLVHTIAEEIASNERSKKHDLLADRIVRALSSSSKKSNGTLLRSTQSMNRGDLESIHRQYIDRPISTLFLEESTRKACEEFIEEQLRSEVLRANGIEPRHRLLLFGPPGNGKTSLAECISSELALPLFIVRYDAVVTSYLGETAKRLKNLFDYARTEPCVLFFDEFDAIGKKRGDLHETGEIKRVVSTLLLQLDHLPSYCVLVAATNHPELLDRATWRRFEIKLELGHPSTEQMIRYFDQRLNEFTEKSGYSAQRLCSVVAPKSYSDAEDFFLDLHRRNTLLQGANSFSTLVTDRLRARSEYPDLEYFYSADERAPTLTSS